MQNFRGEILVVERIEKVEDALVTLLESNVGYQIDFFGGLLSLYQLEDLRFSVNCYEFDSESGRNKWIFEEIFENARDAVEFFERKRREYKLGFDIEGALNREEQKHSEE